MLIAHEEYGLLFKLSKIIIDYACRISADGLYHASDEICEKIDCIAFRLIKTAEAKDFLADIILNCKDDGIFDLFSYRYSKIGDVDELFKDYEVLK